MLLLWILFLVANIISVRSECKGGQGEPGLIIGVSNPAALIAFTPIPVGDNSSFSNASVQLSTSNVQITSVASDLNKGVVFIAMSDTIYMIHNYTISENNFCTSMTPVFTGKSSAFGQIVVDYISNNLYWCDALHQWIAMKPAYNSTNDIYKVLVHKDLRQPEGLALDPEERLMFFSDNGPTPKIEKAYLDGQDREVIVSTELSRVLSLSVDVENNILYWVDNRRHTIEASNYDGSKRRVIKRINGIQFTGLFYYQGLLYAVSATNQLMFGIDGLSGTLVFSPRRFAEQPFAVSVYSTEVQSSNYDPCSNLTCEHMCVNTKSGPKCLCSEEYTLAADARSCTDRAAIFERGFIGERGFIVSNGTMFAMHDVRTISGQEQSSFKYYKLFTTFAESSAFDAKSNIIYVLDSKDNSLKKENMVTLEERTLATTINGKGLIFDWIANLLGWIQAQSNVISYSINSGTTEIIYSNLHKLTSLTVDAQNGVLYWISATTGSVSIERGTWTRESLRVVISASNLNKPYSLQFDVTSQRLFWLDRSLLKSSTTDGSDIKSHVITMGATDAFVFKGFFGWIKGNKIYFARQSSATADYIRETVQNPKSVAVFDTILQQDKRESNKYTAPRVVQVDPDTQVKHVHLGDDFNISCTFYVGIPSEIDPLGLNLKMYWTFNGTEVPDTSKTTYGVGTSDNQTETVFLLTINNAKEEDLGTYQCVGSNQHGADRKNITVDLTVPGDDYSDSLSLRDLIIISLIVVVLGIIKWRHDKQLVWPAADTDHYEVPECDIEYDVFISYSCADEDWVKEELLKSLEADSYKVYIDFKDFVPGKAIPENILEAIYKSRKTIIVMSKNFLKSVWGQYELQQAHNKAIVKRDDVLVLIKYGECKVPARLMGKTFLDWTDKGVKPHFWNRLGNSLGKPGNFRSSSGSAEEKPKETTETVTSSSSTPLSRMTSE